MPSVVEWVSAMSSGSATSTAAIDARASAMRSWNARNWSILARPDRQLARGLLVHRPLGLGRHRPDGPRVEVDPGARRGQQRRIAATFSGSGMNGVTTLV